MKKNAFALLLIFILSVLLLGQPETKPTQTGSDSKTDSKAKNDSKTVAETKTKTKTKTKAETKTKASAEEISPCFKSDKCSLFPDGNYGDCCVAHDKDYFKGGTGKERAASDKRLYRCVKKKKGWQNKLIAPMMWIGVRIFGTSRLPTPFRWGFGKRKKFQKCMTKLEEAKKAKPEEIKEN